MHWVVLKRVTQHSARLPLVLPNQVGKGLELWANGVSWRLIVIIAHIVVMGLYYETRLLCQCYEVGHLPILSKSSINMSSVVRSTYPAFCEVSR